MRILATDIPRAAIDAEIAAASYPGHSPARWALPLVADLDARASDPSTAVGVDLQVDALLPDRRPEGRRRHPERRGWVRVALDEEEFGALWLPAHAGEPCHGDTMTLGDATSGGTLAVLGAWLDAHAAAYAAANPSCWGRIEAARLAQPSCLVISSTSVGDRLKPDHAAFVVVDGLHRALGAWRRGDRACEAYLPK